jgi:two-component system, NtrC family, response regulator PilR
MLDALLGLCTSAKMHPIRDLVAKVAVTNTTVLLRGESGVGKEIVAKAIHKASPRAGKQFLKVNCAALPSELLESELFGHEKGAFTGAYRQKPGKFEAADQGTLLLDEIGEMPLRLQAKLLHVLQDGEFSRVGGEKIIDTDVRLICATNRDLEASMRSHQFREDLYYRINVIQLHLPPLRERREDVPLIAEHFLAKYSEGIEKPVRSISHEALEALSAYDWPGNVRELENAIERAVALEPTQIVLPESLPAQVRARSSKGVGGTEAQTGQQAVGMPELKEGFDLEALGEEFYRHYIALALERAGGVQTKAAEMLGMSFRSFRYYAKKFNLR